jgi:hypothetical protein
VPVLQLDVSPERFDVGRLREQEQVAVLVEIDRHADDLLEASDHRDRFLRQLDVGRVRELMTDAAGVLARRSRRQLRLALEQHDVGDAALRQVPRHAASHAPAAHDYYVCCRSHRKGNLLHFTFPLSNHVNSAPLAYRDE